MKFKTGKSGNPAGRPRGRKNDPAQNLHDRITKYLDKNFEPVMGGMETPSGREKARIYCELLKYTVPRLSPKKSDIKFERLSDAQLDEIIETLKCNALKELRETYPLN
jgi:hypothetical protein